MKIAKPKISVLLANYNNGHYFNDAFESLRGQTLDNWEAIVIDDCSTDNSVSIISNLIKDEPRVRFFQNEKNMGYQKTVIRAIKLSEADIFGRLDPDDALHSTALEKMVKTHKENPQVGLVYSNIIFCNENLEQVRISKSQQITKLDRSYYNFNGEIWPFVTFTRKIYEQTSGIDPVNRRAEDKDIYMKMCEVAPVKYLDEALYFYRVHGRGQSTHDNAPRAFFWHWVALMKMSERRNINIEDFFTEHIVDRRLLEPHQIQRERLLEKIRKNPVLSLFWKFSGKEL